MSLRKGDRAGVDASFKAAESQEKVPPVSEYFEIRPYGHFSSFRDFAEAKAA